MRLRDTKIRGKEGMRGGRKGNTVQDLVVAETSLVLFRDRHHHSYEVELTEA